MPLLRRIVVAHFCLHLNCFTWNNENRVLRNRRNKWLDRILTVRFIISVVENLQVQNFNSKFEGRFLGYHPILDSYEESAIRIFTGGYKSIISFLDRIYFYLAVFPDKEDVSFSFQFFLQILITFLSSSFSLNLSSN